MQSMLVRIFVYCIANFGQIDMNACYCHCFHRLCASKILVLFFSLVFEPHTHTRLSVIVIPTIFRSAVENFCIINCSTLFSIFFSLALSMCFDVDRDKEIECIVYAIYHTFMCMKFYSFPFESNLYSTTVFTLLYTRFFHVFHFDCRKCLQVIIAHTHTHTIREGEKRTFNTPTKTIITIIAGRERARQKCRQ